MLFMWSRQLSQTSAASSLKFDKSAQKSIVFDVFVVSVLVSAQNSPIPAVSASNEYPMQISVSAYLWLIMTCRTFTLLLSNSVEYMIFYYCTIISTRKTAMSWLSVMQGSVQLQHWMCLPMCFKMISFPSLYRY